jgi:hypothetical protein
MRAIAVLLVALLSSGCVSVPTMITHTVVHEKDPDGTITKIIETETVTQQLDSYATLKAEKVRMEAPPPSPPDSSPRMPRGTMTR